jgi:hypothetical protein
MKKYTTTIELFKLVEKEGENYFQSLSDHEFLESLSRLSCSSRPFFTQISEKEIVKRWSNSFNPKLIEDTGIQKDCLYIINNFLAIQESLKYKEEIKNFLIHLAPFIEIKNQLYTSEHDRNFDRRTCNLNLKTYQFLIEHLSEDEFFKQTHSNWWHIAALKSQTLLASYLKEVDYPYQENHLGCTPSAVIADSVIFSEGYFKKEQYQLFFEQEKKINGFEALHFYVYESLYTLNQAMLQALIDLDYKLLNENSLIHYQDKLNEVIEKAQRKPYNNVAYTNEEKQEFKAFFESILIHEEKEQLENNMNHPTLIKNKNKI